MPSSKALMFGSLQYIDVDALFLRVCGGMLSYYYIRALQWGRDSGAG